MAQTLMLTPAYGREYKTKAEALAAWEEGKDFKIVNGPYCSIRDFEGLKRRHNAIIMRFGYGMAVRLL